MRYPPDMNIDRVARNLYDVLSLSSVPARKGGKRPFIDTDVTDGTEKGDLRE
jgi:hypothetical protein